MGDSGSGDARERASELRREIDARIDDVLDAAPIPPGDVYVSWVAALDVVTCPLRYRLGGEAGWGFPGWSPALAGGAVGRAALLHHLAKASTTQPTARPLTPPLPQPIAAVRAWMREVGRGHIETSLADWIVTLLRADDRAALAATAAGASRWLAGFVRVLGWPLPDRLAVVTDDADHPVGRRWHKTYRPGGSASRNSDERGAIAIGSSPDAVLGKVTPSGEYGLVVHRPSSPGDPAVADRAAFDAVAAALVTGMVPAHIVVTTGDTGEKLRITVDAALLARGTDLIVDVVRQRVMATGDDAHDAGDATPSAACRHCPSLDRCLPGQTWIGGPGRWSGGLPQNTSRADGKLTPPAQLAHRAVAATQPPAG